METIPLSQASKDDDKGPSLSPSSSSSSLNPSNLTEINFHYLRNVNTNKSVLGLPRVIVLIVKGIYVLLSMFYHLLFSFSAPDVMILQNPPAIPALAVMIVVARIHGVISFICNFGTIRHQPIVIIDWHNLGFSMFEMKYRKNHIIVKLARMYEKYLSQYADLHFTVTKAMKDWLNENFGLKPSRISVLYDKPPEIFHKISSEKRKQFLMADKMKELIGWNENEKIIISSTSWTPDEDFEMLKDAIKILEKQTNEANLPIFRFIITGKGPLREKFEKEINLILQNSKKIFVRFVWVEANDYPILVGCADLGICLHTSTSGLDLPMKVVDMFGAGVPCLAVNFSCLNELVQNNENGLIFNTAEELAQQIIHLFTPSNEKKLSFKSLKSLQEGAENWSKKKWQQEWEENALSSIKNLQSTRVIKFDIFHGIILLSFIFLFTILTLLTIILFQASQGFLQGSNGSSLSEAKQANQEDLNN